MTALVDTNVLVYRFDPRVPAKQRIARELLRDGISHRVGTREFSFASFLNRKVSRVNIYSQKGMNKRRGDNTHIPAINPNFDFKGGKGFYGFNVKFRPDS